MFVTPYWIQTTLLAGVFYTVAVPLFPQRTKRFQLVCLGFGFLLIVGIMLPLLYLCFQVTPQTLITSVADSVFRDALLTSVATASLSTAVVLLFGVPLAYAIVRLEFPGKGLLESLIDLPIVIPQSVVGIAILVLLGPKTPVGQFLETRLGIEIAGSWVGIVLCQIFVSSPFLVRSTANAFRDMGPALENVSRTLGASPMSTFLRVSLPLASGGIFTGCILTWARAISEAGSLMILAYHPFTVSVYAYDLFIQYGLQESRPAAVLLVIVCLWGFLVLRWLRSATMGPLFSSDRRIGR
jgi:molybdate/tungstate transport system permease protein